MHVLFLCSFLLILLSPAPVGALDETDAPAPAQEQLTYDIGLLWFDRVAEGRLTFGPGDLPGTYRAELEARTLGLAAWLTGDRAHRYVSLMERGRDGRLRPLSHEAFIVKGTGDDRERRGKRYFFDYRNGEVIYQRFKEGRAPSQRKIPLPAQNPPSDILTAFFNFRRDALGSLTPGGHYVIPAFSHKGISDIVIDIVPAGAAHPFFPQGELLARVALDPEVFDTGGGYVYVWFDEQGRPARGIVENVAGLGDVRGVINNEGE